MTSTGRPVRRVAIVGGGNIARSHLRGLTAAAEHTGLPIEVVAVVDVEASRAAEFARTHEIASSFTSVDAMLEVAQPDLVHLCTPPGGHAEQAISCLKAGAHVLCEKPPCLSLAEYDAILAAEDASTATFNVVYQHRFGSAGRHVQALLENGAFGRPFVAQCVTTWFRDHDYYAVPWRGRWETEGGGPTMGHGIHQLDLLGHLLGDWTEVRAMTACLDRPVETEDVSVATVQFASGALATVVNSVLSPREESYIRLDTERASIELTHLYGYDQQSWRVTPAPGFGPGEPGEQKDWALPSPDVASSHAAQITALLESLAAGTAHEASGTSARRTLELITAIYCAAGTGRPVQPSDLNADNIYYRQLSGHPSGSAALNQDARRPDAVATEDSGVDEQLESAS